MVALLNPVSPLQEDLDAYFKLPESFIVIHGTDPVLSVAQCRRSTQLFRLFRKLGRRKEPIRVLCRGEYKLSDESLAALNAFLEHGRGLKFFKCIHHSDTKWNAADFFNDYLRLTWEPLKR
jgi:hypothetical protein